MTEKFDGTDEQWAHFDAALSKARALQRIGKSTEEIVRVLENTQGASAALSEYLVHGISIETQQDTSS